jgi:hypothetical protein
MQYIQYTYSKPILLFDYIRDKLNSSLLSAEYDGKYMNCIVNNLKRGGRVLFEGIFSELV